MSNSAGQILRRDAHDFCLVRRAAILPTTFIKEMEEFNGFSVSINSD